MKQGLIIDHRILLTYPLCNLPCSTVMCQAFLECICPQCIVSSNQRIAESWLIQEGGHGMKSALSRGCLLRFQGDQRPAVEDTAANLVARTVYDFTNVVMRKGIRTPDSQAFRQQIAVQ